MHRHSKIRSAALAAVTALTLVFGNASTSCGKVAVAYSTYCVGYRANLYESDWRLRRAQVEQWRAQEELAAAIRHEGDLAITLEDQQSVIAEYAKLLADSDAAISDAQARLSASQERIASAGAARDAAMARQDSAGASDAEQRLNAEQARASAAEQDLGAARAVAPANEVRFRCLDAQRLLPNTRQMLGTASDNIYALRLRLERAMMEVAEALHDRDEALWLLHREEILAGHGEFAAIGFRVDRSAWGGHLPDDREIVHHLLVHPASYWAERPGEAQARVAEGDSVAEIRTIVEIESEHEAQFSEIEHAWQRVPPEQRQAFAERVAVERERLAADKSERAAAVAEHRQPRVSAEETSEARELAIKAKAERKPLGTTIVVRHSNSDVRIRPDGKTVVAEIGADGNAEPIQPAPQPTKTKAQNSRVQPDAQARQLRAQEQAKARQAAQAAALARQQAAAEARKKQAEAQSQAKSERAASQSAASHAAHDPRSNQNPSNTRNPQDNNNRGSSNTHETRSPGNPNNNHSRDAHDSTDSEHR